MSGSAVEVKAASGRTFRVGVLDQSADGEPAFAVGCSCGFRSTGWPSPDAARERALLHAHEHETGEPGPELVDIRLALGVDVDGGRARAEEA